MIQKYLKYIYIILLLLNLSILKSQNKQEESISNFIANIDTIYKGDFLLKNGRYYINTYLRAKGNQYFNSNIWTNGSLVLLNKEYKDIKMLYDIYNDQLICIVKGPMNEEIPLVLNNDVIKSFQIEDHQFIHSNEIENLPQNGLFEMIFSGDQIQAYAKWKKKFLRIYTKENLGEFDRSIRNLYFKINNVVYPVHKNKDFTILFGLNKKAVKTYMSKNKIKLSKTNNYSLTKLIEYCQEIMNTSNTIK